MFKILAKFSTVIEAEMMQLNLEAHGIKSFVLDSNLSYTLGPTFNEGIRLQVYTEDFEKALSIYKEILDNNTNDNIA